jgi:hypothetical protein
MTRVHFADTPPEDSTHRYSEPPLANEPRRSASEGQRRDSGNGSGSGRGRQEPEFVFCDWDEEEVEAVVRLGLKYTLRSSKFPRYVGFSVFGVLFVFGGVKGVSV